MTPDDRQAQVDALFLRALEVPPAERAKFLDGQCAQLAPEVRPQVDKLIHAHESAEADRGLGRSPALPGLNRVPPHRDPLIGKQVGDYVLRKRIGRGGFGTVYLAQRARDYEQKVAIKLMLPELVADEMARHRFTIEREALAVLQHEYIVRLLDGGSTEDGSPFLVMEYVEGEPITAFCDRERLSIDDRLVLFQKVCTAVSFAHDLGYIHRDIKPPNILVTDQGVPKLLDFGVAKLFDSRTRRQKVSVTEDGIPGTPEYASPEQLRGETQLVSVATDIYSAGVVLYELLTGRLPYDFSSSVVTEIQRVICEEEPLRPSTVVVHSDTTAEPTDDDSPAARSQERQTTPAGLSRLLRGDLETIVLKTLHKETQLRYASAANLAQDIQNYREGKPIQARPDSLIYRGRKFVRRHQLAVLAFGCIALLALTTSCFAWMARLSQQRQEEQARVLLSQIEFEKRERAMERALDAAVNLDWSRAEGAVKEAEHYDASPGWLRMYRGVVAFYRGDIVAAEHELEQSVALEPTRLAAQAMLAVTYLFRGRLEDYAALLHKLESMEPQTAVDFLCKGFAETDVDPVQALQSIREGIRQRDSSMARLMRATARSVYGVQLGDTQMAELAIEDLAAANTFHPDSRMVDIVTVAAHVNAANIFRGQDKQEAVERHLQAAKVELDQLADSDLTAVHVVRADYYLSLPHVRSDNRPLVALAEAVEQGAVGTAAQKYAALLYRRGEMKAASDVLERMAAPQDGATELMRGILQAELVGAEGVTDILGNFEEGDLEQGFPTAGQYILLFLGEKQRAQRRAQRLLATAMSLELPKTWRQQVWHGLQYDSGEITADQYLSRARPNLTHEGRAYLHLALAALADGQRSAAREYFSQVLERIVPSDELYLWSQALLDRMQADPLWPPWIGVDVSSSTAPAE